MKVLLVNPTRERLFSHSSLGLLYLASSLKAAGNEVSYIEGNREELEINLTWDFKFKSLRPQVVGFTVMSPMLQDVLDLAAHVKLLDPRAGVVCGGPHATIRPEDLLNSGYVDVCVLGEGERAFPQLLASCGCIEAVPGLAWKMNGQIKFSEPRAPLSDLDELPFPDRSLLPPKYFSRGNSSIMASRGCPYNCYFCQPTLRKMFGSQVRWRSAVNVAKEMGSAMFAQKIRHFEFFDDTFTANLTFVFELCEILSTWKRLGKRWFPSWEILTRVNAVTPELLRTMKDSGLTRITFGVESGSQEILDYYKKGVTLDQVVNAFKLCQQIGIKTHALFMLGAPMESKETIKATEQLIKRIKPDSIFVSITTPLPGTGLAEDCGEIQDVSEINYYSRPLIKLQHLQPEEILAARKRILRNFYQKKLLDPRFALKFLNQRGWSYVKTAIKGI